jgi:site-specific DNA recombinase
MRFGQFCGTPRYAGRLSVPAWEHEGRGAYVPIVDDQLFNRVQAILNRRRTGTVPHRLDRDDFPLRRFVRCSCGRPMTGSWSRGRNARYPYYTCPRCAGSSLRAESLERQFKSLLESVRANATHFPLMRAVIEDVWNQTRAQQRESAARLNAAIAELRIRRDRAFDCYVANKIDDATWREQKPRLDQELSNLLNQLAEIQQEDLDVAGVLNYAHEVFNDAAGFWNRAPLDVKTRFQRMIFPDGLTLRERTIETAASSCTLASFWTNSGRDGGLVDQGGFVPAGDEPKVNRRAPEHPLFRRRASAA